MPFPHCCQTTPLWSPASSSPSVATNVAAVVRGVPQGADGPAVGLVGVGQRQRRHGALAVGQVLQGPQPVAQVCRGQRRTLAQQAHRAAPGQGDQHVVGTLAVVVHPHRLSLGVGVGDQGGGSIERGHGVQPVGQEPVPLPGHRVLPQEGLRSPFHHCPGVYALLRREVPQVGVRPQDAQAVGHRVRHAHLRQLLQPVPESGSRDSAEAGQFFHGGQGRGAQQEQRVLQCPGQGIG